MLETEPKIEVGVSWAQVVNSDPGLDCLISEAMTAEVKGHYFSPAFQNKTWDGRKRFYNQRTHTLPAGLAPMVADLFNLPIVDVRTAPPAHGVEVLDPPGVELRGYQRATIEIGLKATRGLYSSATGSGKTFTIAGLIHSLKLPTLVLVPGRELLLQTVRELSLALKQPVGSAGGGKWNPKHVTVGIVKTLCSGKHKADASSLLQAVGCLIVDEVHLATSDSYVEPLLECQAFFRFGFSGTPLNKDPVHDMRIIGAFGPVIADIPAMDLVEAGYLAVPQIRFVPAEGITTPDYESAIEYGIIQNDQRNKQICDEAASAEGQQSLVLVQRTDHGRKLAAMMGCKFVCGEDQMGYRRQVLDQFKTGELRRLVASTIYDTGIDAPHLAKLILAGTGEAMTRALQRVGRSLRRTDDKAAAEIVDFWDGFQRHLLEHSRKRLQCYLEQRFPVVGASDKEVRLIRRRMNREGSSPEPTQAVLGLTT